MRSILLLAPLIALAGCVAGGTATTADRAPITYATQPGFVLPWRHLFGPPTVRPLTGLLACVRLAPRRAGPDTPVSGVRNARNPQGGSYAFDIVACPADRARGMRRRRHRYAGGPRDDHLCDAAVFRRLPGLYGDGVAGRAGGVRRQAFHRGDRRTHFCAAARRL